MFRNILVCIDGSAHADAALAEAIDIAGPSGARLTLLTCVLRPPSWASGTTAAASAAAGLGSALEQEAQEIMRRGVDRIPRSIPVTKLIKHDPIRKAIHHELSSGRHDLLVMGSRGRGALAASLLGSVSHYALNHCPVAMLIVHVNEQAVLEQAQAEQAVLEQAQAEQAVLEQAQAEQAQAEQAQAEQLEAGQATDHADTAGAKVEQAAAGAEPGSMSSGGPSATPAEQDAPAGTSR